MNGKEIKKIAGLLRAPEAVIADVFSKMEKIAGKTGMAEKIFQENQALVAKKMEILGISAEKADAPLVGSRIMEKTKEADAAFFEFLGRPDYSSEEGCSKMVELVKKVDGGNLKGLFLKEEKLRSLLFLNPPQEILKALNYQSIEQMLQKEDLMEIFAALRFVESEHWLNEIFFRPYNDLVADNFEEREMRIKVLSQKWEQIGAKFVGKKLHNISHLKEAGVVFLIPTKQESFSGQTLETFCLVLHYLHEIDFYSRLFKKYSTEADFGARLVKLLSGESSLWVVPKGAMNWRVIQKYLAKLDPQDPRLFEAHVNSETLHWLKAEKEIDTLAKAHPELKMDFWAGADDFVGEIFLAGKKGDEITSFDLIDNLVSLTHGGLQKYLYHQQEALWNKIFMEFMGEEKLEEMIVENMGKGFIELK